MSSPIRWAIVPVLLVAFAFVATGCGETVLDQTKTADTLQSSLEKTFHEKIKSVDCPSGVKIEAGKTFTCDVVFSNGKQATATLKIRDKDGDMSFVGLKPSK